MAPTSKARRAVVSWEGDSLEVLRDWPKAIREDFGVALNEMQEGRQANLPVRPMASIAAGVFELKDADANTWYRLIYLSRRDDVIYVLHCFTKNTARTDRRDLAAAEERWKQVQHRLKEEQRHATKVFQSGKKAASHPRKRAG